MTYQREYPRLAPWWSPWGLALRLARTIRQPSDVYWLGRIGWFVLRLPDDLERSHLRTFLGRLAAEARPRADDPHAAMERVARLRRPWLRLPGLRSRDTCYVRALTLYRFLDAAGHEMKLRVGAEWFDRPGGVLRGHAWVAVDGKILEGPPEADEHERLQLIDLGAY
ncbi:MAG TPA: lasso peptide biosynthesis B2 protein [Xanthomonadaceae bacterium]|nr:lasso peptide biosynthesis B2 protein [Xanthomonadaceae bacterium]